MSDENDNRNTLFINMSPWEVEKRYREKFFWYSDPFKKTCASGFIVPGTKVKKNFPLLLLVDLFYCCEKDLDWIFNLQSVSIVSRRWNPLCSKVATLARSIVASRDGKETVIKKDYEILSI
ncbi:MAG: hypothetical protein R6W70_09830 [bacterium]